MLPFALSSLFSNDTRHQLEASIRNSLVRKLTIGHYVLGSLGLSVPVVALCSIYFNGRVTLDYVITALVATPFVSGVLNGLTLLYHRELELRNQLLAQEQRRSESLLLNILPKEIAVRLKEGEEIIADQYDDVTVLFADMVGFTRLAERLPVVRVVDILNQAFCAFDRLTELYGLEKIKTIGDAYMIVGGAPTHRADHCDRVAHMALHMQREMKRLSIELDEPLSLRIGIHCGNVIAGVIGRKKFVYDLWGDTVNTASRMESHGIEGGIQVSEAVYERLKGRYHFQARGELEIKGKGRMSTWLLTDMAALGTASEAPPLLDSHPVQ